MVRGKLDYIADIPLYDREKPYDLTIDLWHTPEAKPTNVLLSERDVYIKDMSSSVSDFSIDVQGFQVLRYPTKLSNKDLADDSLVTSKYYKECEDILMDHFGAKQVFIFDHLSRKANTNVELAGVNERQKQLGPATGLHIDQTPNSARKRAAQCLPEQAEELLRGRFRLLNIWRPLISPVETHPLVLCDYRTTKPSQLVASDLVSPHYEGEQYWVKYSPDHQYWHYKDVTRDEVFVIKCFDSAAQKDEKIAKYSPHTSFTYSEATPNSRPRESFEIRALVFSET